MIENILYNNSYLFHYSYCGKTTFDPDKIHYLIIGNSCLMLTTLSITSELIAHMFIYVRQTKIENRAQVCMQMCFMPKLLSVDRGHPCCVQCQPANTTAKLVCVHAMYRYQRPCVYT